MTKTSQFLLISASAIALYFLFKKKKPAQAAVEKTAAPTEETGGGGGGGMMSIPSAPEVKVAQTSTTSAPATTSTASSEPPAMTYAPAPIKQISTQQAKEASLVDVGSPTYTGGVNTTKSTSLQLGFTGNYKRKGFVNEPIKIGTSQF